MNISEQLNLLKNIKNSIKNRLIERKADIDDTTPFSQYSRYILTIDRTVFTDLVLANNQPTNIKENIISTNTDFVMANNPPINIRENFSRIVTDIID